MKIVNRNPATASSNDLDNIGIEENQDGSFEREPQMFQLDGEALWFNNFVKMEAVPSAVPVIVNYEEMMQ